MLESQGPRNSAPLLDVIPATAGLPPSQVRDEVAFAFLREVGLAARELAYKLRGGQRACQGHSFIAEALCRELGIEAEVNASSLPYHFFCTAVVGDRIAVLDAYPEGIRRREGVVVCWRYGNQKWQPYDNGDPLDQSDTDTGSLMFKAETWEPLRREALQVVKAHPEVVQALRAKQST